MTWVTILAAVGCLCSVIALVIRNTKPNAISITFSVMGTITSFIALALATPRNVSLNNLGVDYLGGIVVILGAFATLLLAMQLYNVFSVKADAQKVAEAKDIIEKYAGKVSDLTEKIKKLEKKADDAIYFDDLAANAESIAIDDNLFDKGKL